MAHRRRETATYYLLDSTAQNVNNRILLGKGIKLRPSFAYVALN